MTGSGAGASEGAGGVAVSLATIPEDSGAGSTGLTSEMGAVSSRVEVLPRSTGKGITSALGASWATWVLACSTARGDGTSRPDVVWAARRAGAMTGTGRAGESGGRGATLGIFTSGSGATVSASRAAIAFATSANSGTGTSTGASGWAGFVTGSMTGTATSAGSGSTVCTADTSGCAAVTALVGARRRTASLASEPAMAPARNAASRRNAVSRIWAGFSIADSALPLANGPPARHQRKG